MPSRFDDRRGIADRILKLAQTPNLQPLFFISSKSASKSNNSYGEIRRIKVKEEISDQFKLDGGSCGFAILSSNSDTTIRPGRNIFNLLNLIAKSETE